VRFNHLALCIIDEQHRFGVEQRRILREKGEKDGRVPHLLVMTATPIPRSLALTLYGDMALSVIDELPPGRTPVATKVVVGDAMLVARRLAAKIIRDDEQAYVIYPLVAESEKMDLRNAVEAYQTLCAEFGPDHFAIVHGQMKADAKEAAMKNFAEGRAKVLISTTVVEVGVDVPNASHMLIMNAERFGLSQLHQLRGRVGRGSKASHCYLAIEQSSSENARRRLAVMERTNDGFEIANEDLAIRGAGDLLGSRQAGLELFNFFDFAQHGDLVELARQSAIAILKQDPTLSASWLQPFISRADTFLGC
jgi:ATP-dependent DNA helicase RecG